MTDHTCHDCSRGARWNAGGRAARIAEMERLDAQRREFETRIREIDRIIERADREVVEHAASCPEARRA